MQKISLKLLRPAKLFNSFFYVGKRRSSDVGQEMGALEEKKLQMIISFKHLIALKQQKLQSLLPGDFKR